jgi:tetratricopeptide (TPR) repeat protein
MRRASVSADEVLNLIAEKARLLDESANHYRLLGVQFGAGESDVRVAYFRLAKRLHPDRLQALGLVEPGDDAQRVFAAINQAFAVLSDRRKAAEYRMMLERGGIAAELDEADAEQVFARILAAEEAFRLGEMALKRSHWPEALERFEQAVELNPQEGEHHAYLAWTQWCAAPNKNAILATVREGMALAAEVSPKSPTVFLLRAHVAKQAGDYDRAERYFRKVLKLEPTNVEAETELRILQTQKR